MFGFTRNKPDELEELKKEVRELRETVSQLKYENEIRVGEFPHTMYGWGWHDPRPKVSMRRAVEMILERMGLEIKHTKGYDSTTLEKKKKAPNV